MADDTIGESSIAEPEDKIDPMASTASVSHRVEGRNESHAANTVVGDGTFAEQDYISTRRSFRSSAASRDNERCGSSGAASIFTAEEHGERSLSVEATVDDGSFSPSAGSQTGTPRGGSDGTNEAVHEEAILEEQETPGTASRRPTLQNATDVNTYSRPQTPTAARPSPASSRNSSLSSGTPPRRTSESVSLTSRKSRRSLGERLEAALRGPGTEGERRILVSASSGVNLRAVDSPSSSVGSRYATREERGKSMPTSGARGVRPNASRAVLSAGTSPRGSRSPDGRRNSVSFVEYMSASHSELSLMDSSRASTVGGKRPRDRNALRVAIRVRPIIDREKGCRTVTCQGGENRLVVVNPKKFKASADAVLAAAVTVSRANMTTADWLRPFDFDRVFWSTPSVANKAGGGDGNEEGVASSPATQRSVYEGLGDRIVEDALNGINSSCFAYGHTGSGKTYSMFGRSIRTPLRNDPAALAAAPEGEGFGLVPRVCYQLLHRLLGDAQESGTPDVNLTVQFIEIYNDKIRDLLHPGADSSAFRVREHPDIGPYVHNLIPVQVESWAQLHELLVRGSAARTEADTPENSKSSRGHAILTLQAMTPAGLSRVQMVDLAGSEREVSPNPRADFSDNLHGRPRRDSTGDSADTRTLSQRLRETAQIKKALSNLGIIIKGLSRGDSAVGLPFRDSVLTWLLKEALSGRAHTTMLATISPSSDNYVETMNTLKYAERLRRASAHLYWNRDAAGAKPRKVSDGMKREMAPLVEQLGADGIEAKRQVLLQTVADPQQRIAKLTASDSRRRRASTSGLPSETGARVAVDNSEESRRTTYPGTPSPNRFGWNPPSPPSGVVRHHSTGAGQEDTTWGSPICALQDESAMGDITAVGEDPVGGLDETKSYFSQKMAMSDNSSDGAESRSPNAATSDPVENSDHPHGSRKTRCEEDAEKLYSQSMSDLGADGGDDGVPTGSHKVDEINDDHALDTDTEFPEGEHEAVELAGATKGDDHASILPVDSLSSNQCVQQSSPHSPESCVRLSWAGTSSSDDSFNDGSELESEAMVDVGVDLSAGTQMSNPVAQDEKSSLVGTTNVHEQSDAAAPVSPAEDSGEVINSLPSTEIPHGARSMTAQSEGGVDYASAVGTVGGAGPTTMHSEGNVDLTPLAGRVDGTNPTATHVEAVSSTSAVGRVGGANANLPPRRVSWQQEEEERNEDPDGRRKAIRPTEESTAKGKVGADLSDDDYASVMCGSDTLEGGMRADPGGARSDEARPTTPRSYLNSSVESGGGAAALAASGVFDMTGTSGEAEGDEEGISVGDVDSLDDVVAHDDTWMMQRLEVEPDGQEPVKRDGTGTLDEEERGQLEAFMRQVEQLQDSNTALVEEVSRLKAELQICKDSEQKAWVANTENASRVEDMDSKMASMQQRLDEESERARQAEMVARETASKDVDRILAEARTRETEADQRAATAEATAQSFVARAKEDNGHILHIQALLEQEKARTKEEAARADQSEAALHAAGGDIDVALRKSQLALEEERVNKNNAESKARRALARVTELATLVNGHNQNLKRARDELKDNKTRKDEAEARERLATKKVDELAARVSERDDRLARARDALEAEGARADEAEEGKRGADDRTRELEREAERQRVDLKRVRRENEEFLAEVRAAAETEMKRSANRRDAILEERDRALEQVQAERTEVLRLTAALGDIRSSAWQDTKAAEDREAQLKGVLAAESEASRAEQAEVEELLSLISSAQAAEAGADGIGGPISIAGARDAVENERLEHEAMRRRLQVVEEENRALRRRDAEGQVRSERAHGVESERNLLVKEKDELGERLERLEARQRLAEERERQACSRENEACSERKELEAEFQSVEKLLAKETELRAQEANAFADRLKESEEEQKAKFNKQLQQVMEGVRSQAGHIRGKVIGLEKDKAEALSAKDAAAKELEDLKCQLGIATAENGQTKKDFDEQMKQSARERAALWLAVNKLDVLEAAKDAAMKELQAEGENNLRDLKALQAENTRLKGELGQIDLSLMQALEDNDLTLDSVNLQKTAISRRLGRRSLKVRGSITNGDSKPGASSAGAADISAPSVTHYGPAGGRVRSARRGTAVGAYAPNKGGPWPWAASGSIATGRDSTSKVRSRSLARPPDARFHQRSNENETVRLVGVEGKAGEGRELIPRAKEGPRDGHAGHMARAARRVCNDGSSSLRVDHWDPAMNTIEREIEHISDRLNDQKEVENSTARMHGVSSHADLAGGASLEASRQGMTAKRLGIPSGTTGKRSRVRGAEGSPPRMQDTQRPRTERSGVGVV